MKQNSKSETPLDASRQSQILGSRNATLKLLSTCTFLVLAYFLSHSLYDGRNRQHSSTETWTHRSTQAPRKNIWAQLTTEEATEVKTFLLMESGSLNLTARENATSWDNYIYSVETLRPNKSDAITYLSGESTTSPLRWASVGVYAGTQPDSYIHSYMVGPLPITENTQVHNMSYCFNSGRSYNQNRFPHEETLLDYAPKFLGSISDITKTLLGTPQSKNDNMSVDDLEFHMSAPSVENNRTFTWGTLVRNGSYAESPTLLPQGLYMKLDITAKSSDDWRVLEWMYNGEIYTSTEEFRAEIKRPGFQKTGLNLDGEWTVIEDFSDGHHDRDLPAPVMVRPSTTRYRLDHKENFISWMGFEFFISFSHVTGISLYDIRFNGDLIIYELGLQEALAHYAGDDPIQGRLAFLDTFFSMGRLMFELVPGYDCPSYASFLNSTVHLDGVSKVLKNSICVFEYTSDHALQRHTAAKYVSISKNTYLVIRATSTVGNYDYTFDYIFYLDGSIEVKVRASGYISGSYWTSTRSQEYGYRVHDHFSTSIHDHVLNFKADLDILGTNNTIVRVDFEPTESYSDWATGRTHNTMKLIHKPISEETGLNWLNDPAAMYVVQSHNLTNAWGQKRGYSIRPGTGIGAPTHLTIQNSSTIGRAAEWATKDLWVVQQKDTEPRSSDPWNSLTPEDPLIDFGKFVDGDNIDKEDLVVYFNLGNHHLAHSGDIPNTLMHTSASSVIFSPHNFHDRDVSRRSSQGVRVGITESKGARYYGGRYKNDIHVGLDLLEPDLGEYGVKEQVEAGHIGHLRYIL